MKRMALGILLFVALVAAPLALLASCSHHDDAPVSTLTAAQRDSVLARSSLPGARVVAGALNVSAAAASRAAAMDTIGR